MDAGPRRLWDDAWYWTKVVFLNNLLNGSPHLPYYEPRAISKWFFAAGPVTGILLTVGWPLAARALFPTWAPDRLWSSMFSVPVMLLAASSSVLVTVRGMRLGTELVRKPAAHRLWVEAYSAEDPARRRTLAEQSLALDPENVRSRLFLASVHEHQLGEPDQARLQLSEVIDAIDRAIAIKREKGAYFHGETALRTEIVGHVARLSPSAGD